MHTCISDPDHPHHVICMHIMHYLLNLKKEEDNQEDKSFEDLKNKIRLGDLDFKNDDSGEIQ